MLGHSQAMQATVYLDQRAFAGDGDAQHILATGGIEASDRHVVHETQVDTQERQDAGLAIQQDALLVRRPGLAGLQASHVRAEGFRLSEIASVGIDIRDEARSRSLA